MTNEERDLITRFIERVGGAAASAGASGSVPQTSGQQQLAPVDHEADGLIGDLFSKYPEARYRITQLAFVQEHALNAAQQRIAAMQKELDDARSRQGSAGSPWGGAAQGGQPQSRGFFGSLFGGGSAQQQPAQAPQQYAPPPGYGQQPYAGAPPAMFQQQGSGFLGGALRTAAGVAGGVVAANALMGLFSGGHSGGGLFGGDAQAAGYSPPGGEGTWTDAAAGGAVGGAFGADPYDQGGAAKDEPASDNSAWQSGSDPGWQQADQGGGGWQPVSDNSGWQDAPADDTGGGDWGGGDSGWTDSSDP